MKRLDLIRERNRSGEQVSTIDLYWLLARVDELARAIRAIDIAQEGDLPDIHKGLQRAINNWGLYALAKLDEEVK